MKRKRTDERELLELPMDITPPTREQVAASAAASPLLATLTKLREWLGPEGRSYRANRTLSFEPQALATILGINQIPDPDGEGPDDLLLSSQLRPRLAMAVAVATDCGAIDEVGNGLVPAAGWDDDDEIVRASVALSALIDLGPMQTSLDTVDAYVDVRDWVIDESFVCWLATLLPPGRTQHVAHFVDWAIGECRQQFGGDPSARPGEFDIWIDNGTCYMIDTLTWAGAIEWTDREIVTVELDRRVRWFGRGTVSLTPLGRHVLPDHLAAAGVKLRDPEPVDPGRRSARGLLGDVLVAGGRDEIDALVDGWRRDLDDGERARLVVDVLNESGAVQHRMSAFEVLDRIGAEAAAPHVRQLLDSPAAEAAARFLVEHGLADQEHVAPYVGPGPLIDALAGVVNKPDLFREQFVWLLEVCEAPELLLEVFALYETMEATMVITAAARHVDDPRFASLVQAAERRHHAVMLGRDEAC